MAPILPFFVGLLVLCYGQDESTTVAPSDLTSESIPDDSTTLEDETTVSPDDVNARCNSQFQSENMTGTDLTGTCMIMCYDDTQFEFIYKDNGEQCFGDERECLDNNCYQTKELDLCRDKSAGRTLRGMTKSTKNQCSATCVFQDDDDDDDDSEDDSDSDDNDDDDNDDDINLDGYCIFRKRERGGRRGHKGGRMIEVLGICSEGECIEN